MSETKERYLIRGARVVQPDGIIDADLVIENGIISHIGDAKSDLGDCAVIEGAGRYVLPGFIDIHLHGGMGFDLTSGRWDTAKEDFDPSLEHYQNSLSMLAQHLAGQGVTSAMLSTIAAPGERLEAALGELATYIESDANGVEGTDLFGAFIEGTFVHNPAFAGAQNPDYFRAPDIEIFERLNAAARGRVLYVNVAPEYGESALTLTKQLTDRGVLVGAGHTSCPATQFMKAVDNGLKVAVHFTNGPTGTSFKPFDDGNVLEAVLTSRKVYAEQIADGYHINPAYVMDIFRRKGADRIIAVSDAFFVTGSSDIDRFVVGGIGGQVDESGEYLRVLEKENTLFGSVLVMSKAFSNWVSWLTREMPGIWNERHDPVATDEAVTIASQLCSGNPARIMGRYDGAERGGCIGSLEVGKRADVQLVTLDGADGAYDAKVDAVFVQGRQVVGG